MIKLFKDLMFFYILSVLAGAVAISALSYILDNDMGFAFFYCIVWIMFIGCIFVKKANKRYLKIMDYMNGCQIGKFIEETEKLSKSRAIVNQTITLNLSSAYINIGNTEKAMELLKTVPVTFSEKPAVMANEFVYFNNLFAAYYFSGEKDKAAAAFESMKLYLDNPNFREPHRSMCEKYYIDKKFKLDMANGKYDGALEHFTSRLNAEVTVLGKVNCHFYLGLIALHNNDSESAKEHFEFVSLNGGDTFFCAKAKEKLTEQKV